MAIVDETIPDAVQTLTLDDADQTGHVTIDATLDLPKGVASPLRAELDAGLTEPGGRAVRDTLSVPVRTHAVLIGLRKMFGDQVDTGDAAAFAVRGFDADGKPPARTGLAWRLVEELEHWDWWRGDDGNSPWTFHYYTFDSDIAKGTLDVPGGPAGRTFPQTRLGQLPADRVGPGQRRGEQRAVLGRLGRRTTRRPTSPTGWRSPPTARSWRPARPRRCISTPRSPAWRK